MILKHFFLTSILILAVSLDGHAQSGERKFNGDETYLRMCIQWDDSAEYQIPSYPNSPDRTIYKFKVRSLFWGIYEELEIYVGTYKPFINKFNSLRELGHDYFWTLRKSEYTVNGSPLYLHSGSF